MGLGELIGLLCIVAVMIREGSRGNGVEVDQRGCR